MLPNEEFLYFLTDYAKTTPTSTIFYYTDESGKVQTTGSPQLATRGAWLRHAPDGWLQSKVTFGRSEQYYGLNRSFNNPLKFVRDGATIIRDRVYNGAGADELIGLLIFQYLPWTGKYELYYDGLLDVINMEDNVAEGITVPLIEGGALAMLKTYQDTEFALPCDGSIKENIWVNMDGLLVQDTFNYTFVPAVIGGSTFRQTLPIVYTGNEADNFGTLYNSQSNELVVNTVYPNYFSGSQNYSFSYTQATSVTISGTISLKTDASNNLFQLLTATSQSNTTTNPFQVSLVPFIGLPPGYQGGVAAGTGPLWMPASATYNFNVTIPLLANENLFIIAQIDETMTILGGGFNLTFNSSVAQKFVVGIAAKDAYALLIQEINQLSTTSGVQSFSFAPVSTLLENNSNLVLTSGDALRAAGDPNYMKYYNPAQTTLLNPTYTFFDFIPSVGPVLKLSLSNFFKSMNAVLNASLSNQSNPTPGMPEQLFFESKEYVFDSSQEPMDLTVLSEIAKVKIKSANDYLFNALKIGYTPQNYDEKEGKFEYNTTAQWSTPIRTVNKTLELVSDFRTDSYGIQYTLANLTSDTKSSTYNGSDNSVFILNVDTSTTVLAYQMAAFTPEPASTHTGDGSANNQRIQPAIFDQGITMPTLTGADFCSYNFNNPSVFVICNPDVTPGLGTPPTQTLFSYTGYISGVQGVTSSSVPNQAIIYAFVNNTVVGSKQWIVNNTAQLPISGSFLYSGPLNEGDCLYMKVVTSPYCTCTISTPSEINVGYGTAYPAWFLADTVGEQTINPGTGWFEQTYGQLIVFGNVNPVSSVYRNPNASTNPLTGGRTYGASFGFAMLVFNDVLNNPNFTYDYLINYLVNSVSGGASPGNVTTKLYYIPNTPSTATTCILEEQTQLMSGTGFGPTQLPVVTQNPNNVLQLNLGDVLFMLVNVEHTLENLEITNPIPTIGGTTGVGCYFMLKSQTPAYDLLRKQYDAVSGIPTLLAPEPSAPGLSITTGPGAPYNIEQLTPRRLLQNHGNWIAGCLNSVATRNLIFQILDKNQFLYTSLAGQAYQENQSTVEISSLGDPLFYPWIITFTTQVPMTFQQVMTGARNAYVKCSYAGVDIYGFPLTVSAMPGLNWAQEWEMLVAPPTDLAALTNLNYSGLSNLELELMTNEIYVHHLNPVQFVPLGVDPNALYHFIQMDQDWFVNQTLNYIETRNYYCPWQSNDTISLQVYTNGLANVQATIIDCYNNTISVTNFTNITTATSVILPNLLWKVSLPLTGLVGTYYIIISAGAGGLVQAISEPLNIQVDQPQTLLFQYSHPFDTQNAIFSDGWLPTMRVSGYIGNFMAEANFTSYEDQPADLTTLNGIPYRSFTLYLGIDQGGSPDYIANKINRIMLLAQVSADGINYSREKDAKWDVDAPTGTLKKFWRLQVREAKASYGVTIGAGTGINTKPVVAYNFSADAFGTNNGQSDIIQVTQTD